MEYPDGTVRHFERISDAARYLHISDVSVLHRIQRESIGPEGLRFWYANQPRPCFRQPMHHTRPIKVLAKKDGESIAFSSYNACAIYIGSNPADVRKGVINDRKVKGWEVSWLTEELTKEDKEFIGMQLSPDDINRLIGQRKERPRREADNARHIPVTKRKVLYGFYDEAYGPAVCPVCGLVFQAVAKNKGVYLRHFEKCLDGRRWRLRVDGVIEVDADANKLANTKSFTSFLKGRAIE